MEQTYDFEIDFPQMLELVLANLPLIELLTSCRYIPALSPSYKHTNRTWCQFFLLSQLGLLDLAFFDQPAWFPSAQKVLLAVQV